MASFDGEIFSAPDSVFGRASGHRGQHFNSAQGKTTHYKLRAHRTSDDTWQTWVDTSVGLGLAPGGAGNYDAASLTIEDHD